MTYANLTELIDAVAVLVKRDAADPAVIGAANAATEYVAFDNDLTPSSADVTTRDRDAGQASLTTATDHGIEIGEQFTAADVGDGFDGVQVAVAGTTATKVLYLNAGSDVGAEPATGTVSPLSATGSIPDAEQSPLTFRGLTLLGGRIVVDTPTPDGQVVATTDAQFAGVFVPEQLASHLRDYWRRYAETMGAA